MSKLTKAFKAFRSIIQKPYLLNMILDRNEEWKNTVAKGYPEQANGFRVVQPWDLFEDFNVEIDPYAFLDGGSLATDLGLLIKFAGSLDTCSYFEIGTWRGESVANVARFANECFTLNLSSEELRAMGLSEDYINQQALFSRDLKNVVQLEGNSGTYDFEGLGKKFDLIFIDGDHHYKSVKSDTYNVFKHLVHENSIVVWHDYAHHPEMVRYEVMAGILDGVPKDLHSSLYHFAHSKSAFYTGKNYDSVPLKAPVKPKRTFRVNLSDSLLTDN